MLANNVVCPYLNGHGWMQKWNKIYIKLSTKQATISMIRFYKLKLMATESIWFAEQK